MERKESTKSELISIIIATALMGIVGCQHYKKGCDPKDLYWNLDEMQRKYNESNKRRVDQYLNRGNYL